MGKQQAQTPNENPLFKGQKDPKKQRNISTLEQWIEVRIVDGKTVTTLYPPNKQLVKDGKKIWPPPDVVYRRFHFPDGVPAEYYWTSPDDAERHQMGGCGIQRMSTGTWLEVIRREAHNRAGHLGPTGVGNLPRPKERGGCECLVCTLNQDLIESPDEEPTEDDPDIPEPGSACR